MRILMAAALLAVVSLPVLADEKEDDEKNGRAMVMLGFGYREGSVRPALTVAGSAEDLPADTTIVFGEVRDSMGYLYAETTYPADKPLLETHAFGAHGDIFSIFGFRADLGLDYRYLTEETPVFGFEDTRLDSVRRQHLALLSLGWGVGAYDGPVYFRHNAVLGAAHVESTLDVSVTGVPRHRNGNAVGSGWFKLAGYRGEVGVRAGRLLLSAGGMSLRTLDDHGGLLPGSQNIVFGTARVSTPWLVGVYVHGEAARETPNLLFMGNSVTFGLTLNTR